MIRNSNILPLAFYDSLEKQNAAKWYAYGQVYAMPFPVGELPPFQIIREKTGDAVTAATLVRVSDGSTSDVLAEMQLKGLEVLQPDGEDLDIVIYPGTISLDYSNLGNHYLVLSDGTNTWYSEYFCFRDGTEGLVRIEYYHGEDFCVPGGIVRYRAPYKNRVYLCTDIGKPVYEYQEEVIERDGRNFPTKQISIKRFKFNVVLPEFLIDALRLVQLHDFVEVYNYRDGRNYEVDELEMNDPSWEDFGDLADVTFEFTTDTVVVNAGRPATSVAYEVDPASCIVAQYEAVALIRENSSNYNNGSYLDNSGNTVRLAPDDYVVVVTTTQDIILEQWNGSSFSTVTLTDGDVVYQQVGTQYFYADSGILLINTILTYNDTTGVVTAQALPGVYSNLYASDGSTDTLLGQFTQAQLESGVTVTVPSGADVLYLESTSANCPVFATSNLFRITTANIGVGFWVVGSDNIVQ
jgi:hypothetical protein